MAILDWSLVVGRCRRLSASGSTKAVSRSCWYSARTSLLRSPTRADDPDEQQHDEVPGPGPGHEDDGQGDRRRTRAPCPRSGCSMMSPIGTAESRGSRPGACRRSPPVQGEEGGQADDQGELGELRGLELEAGQLEPGLGALALGAQRREHGEQEEQGAAVDGEAQSRSRGSRRPPGGHQADADDHEDGLALEEVGGRGVVGPLGGAVDHHDADRDHGQGGHEQDPVDVLERLGRRITTGAVDAVPQGASPPRASVAAHGSVVGRRRSTASLATWPGWRGLGTGQGAPGHSARRRPPGQPGRPPHRRTGRRPRG